MPPVYAEKLQAGALIRFCCSRGGEVIMLARGPGCANGKGLGSGGAVERERGRDGVEDNAALADET